MTIHHDFKEAIWYAGVCLRDRSTVVHTEKWQSVDISKKPEMATHEVKHHFMHVPMRSESLDYHREQIKPNLPWADDHFEERACGQPINPGVQWQHWPYSHSANKFRDRGGKFNHNYMERYWPRNAGHDHASHNAQQYSEFLSFPTNRGIYHPYGDLQDVVNQLVREPHTRQAILPVWFPEDTGVVHRGRVPCSIAYQFFMRNSQLDISYMLRSCDYLRHFRDDIYLTVRLALWVLTECRKKSPLWDAVKPGQFIMLITSLHCFRNDYQQLFSTSKSNE